MSYCGVSIFSENLSGQTANVTFYPCSGGTIPLGEQTFPFTYSTDYWYGTYECYVPTYAYTYVVDVPCPSPTPTPTQTQTPTNTETQTPTPTPTNTETQTPTPTQTQTPTNSETPTQTQTPTNSETPTQTPTNSETPTQTPTNSETPTQTPTNSETPTQTPTPTISRIAFTVYSGLTQIDACSQMNSPITIYGNNQYFDLCTQFWDTMEGDSTVDMTGYYNNFQNVVELDSEGFEINGYTICATLTPTPTNTETPTQTPSGL